MRMLSIGKSPEVQQLKGLGLPAFSDILTSLGTRIGKSVEPFLRSLAARLQSWDRELSLVWKRPVYGLLLLLFSLLIYLPSWMYDSVPKEQSNPAVMIAPLPKMDPMIAPDTLLIYLSPKPICYEE